MTCDDFLLAWNARIDDPASFPSARAESLDAHATSCDHCRRLSSGFRLIAHGLPAPAVPDGLSDRVLAAWAATERRDRRGRLPVGWGWAAGLAAAAVALAMILPGLVRRGQKAEVAVSPTAAPRNLSAALAQATSATLDLARETSAPAARLGQDAYLASLPRDISWPVAIEPSAASSDLLQSMSRSVQSGVRPLSGSARRAFSFLIAPGPTATDRGSPKQDPDA